MMKINNMRNVFFLILSFFILNMGLVSQECNGVSLVESNLETEFDSTYLKNDLENLKNPQDLPLTSFTFPRTRYNGSAAITDLLFKDKRIKGTSYFVGNYDKFKFDDESDGSVYREFFTIIIISEDEDINLQDESAKISSRNFPDYYLVQGKFKFDKYSIDYIADISCEGEGKVIVNEKIFNINNSIKTLVLYAKQSGELNYSLYSTPFLEMGQEKSFYSDFVAKHVRTKND